MFVYSCYKRLSLIVFNNSLSSFLEIPLFPSYSIKSTLFLQDILNMTYIEIYFVRDLKVDASVVSSSDKLFSPLFVPQHVSFNISIVILLFYIPFQSLQIHLFINSHFNHSLDIILRIPNFEKRNVFTAIN